MNILFYFPTSLRANSLSSLMIAFQQQGHQVHFVSHNEEGELHADVKPFGVITKAFVTNKKGLFFYRWQYKQLKRYIQENNIQLVFAHTQPANFIACHLRTTARIILCRHHTDYVYYGTNKNAKRFDRIINKRGKEFIVPAKKTFDQMVRLEGVNPGKIKIIPYGYDFSQYPLPNENEVKNIRQQYATKTFLLSMGRMMPEKRHLELIDLMHRMKNENIDSKLVILGDGQLRTELEKKVDALDLRNYVYMPGRKTNIMDYLAACDILIHNSESETSCSVVKEAALVEKPVIACNDVGDFDEYLIHNQNALMLPKHNYLDTLVNYVKAYEQKKEVYNEMGKQLKKDVLSLFSVKPVAKQYESFFTL